VLRGPAPAIAFVEQILDGKAGINSTYAEGEVPAEWSKLARDFVSVLLTHG
jgi:hypothetical protein